MLNLNTSRRKTNYFSKDQAKADIANKFIGRGSQRSSTHAYALACGPLANCGNYCCDDIVMVSAEGNRSGRLDPDFSELQRAVLAGAHFITDTPGHRARSYNIGERQIAAFLAQAGYIECSPGRWRAA